MNELFVVGASHKTAGLAVRERLALLDGQIEGFLQSLDVTDALDARLALAGHARPFTDVAAHIEANRRLEDERLEAVRGALAGGPRTAYEIARAVYGESYTDDMASWLMTLTRAWLVHLQHLGEAQHDAEAIEHWVLGS